jgi:hypothetical protein
MVVCHEQPESGCLLAGTEVLTGNGRFRRANPDAGPLILSGQVRPPAQIPEGRANTSGFRLAAHRRGHAQDNHRN